MCRNSFQLPFNYLKWDSENSLEGLMVSSNCWGPGLIPDEGILQALGSGPPTPPKKKVEFILTSLLGG